MTNTNPGRRGAPTTHQLGAAHEAYEAERVALSDPAPDPVEAAIQRVTAHLDRYAQMGGPIHPEIIHAFTDSQLTVSDLRLLLAAAGAPTDPEGR